MTELQIEDLLKGLATGNYLSNAGSRFGSSWGDDGLFVRAATPDECAAFGASSRILLCHGRSVNWLGQDWSSILAYNGGKLAQVNIHTETNDIVFVDVRRCLDAILGKSQEASLPQDDLQNVTHRFGWAGKDGMVSLIRTPTYIQLSFGPSNLTSTSAGCLGSFLLLASVLTLAGLLAYS
jgi:hypothetical protein